MAFYLFFVDNILYFNDSIYVKLNVSNLRCLESIKIKDWKCAWHTSKSIIIFTIHPAVETNMFFLRNISIYPYCFITHLWYYHFISRKFTLKKVLLYKHYYNTVGIIYEYSLFSFWSFILLEKTFMLE